ncbi:MAG: hypothetical protein ABL983_07765 [Nitrospira sp.]
MTPIDGHDLRRASSDCSLCTCGKAFFSINDQPNAREIRLMHAIHVDEIRKARARITEAQKNKQQADFADEQTGFNPFRQGVLGNR